MSSVCIGFRAKGDTLVKVNFLKAQLGRKWKDVVIREINRMYAYEMEKQQKGVCENEKTHY